MARVHGPFPIIGTWRRFPLTFYMMKGENHVRTRSSLKGHTVKTSPKFIRTRAYAELLGHASKIASEIYQGLPPYWRQFWMYRAFTGEAIRLMKCNKTDEEVRQEMWEVYVKEWENKPQAISSELQALSCKPQAKRKYRKVNEAYWTGKTAKANKRKVQQQQLQRNTGLMGRASKIGSVVYRSLPADKRDYSIYKTITGQAMKLLKQELEDDQVQKFLMKESVSWMIGNRNPDSSPITIGKDDVGSAGVYGASIRLKHRSIFCIPPVNRSSARKTMIQKTRDVSLRTPLRLKPRSEIFSIPLW